MKEYLIWLEKYFLQSLNLRLQYNRENPYDLIVKDIKEKCKYYKIINYKGTDYVTYSCSESSYKGKIGFMVEEGQGIVRHFPTIE